MSLKCTVPQQHRRVRVILIEATGPPSTCSHSHRPRFSFCWCLSLVVPSIHLLFPGLASPSVHLIQTTSCDFFFFLALYFFLGDFLDFSQMGLLFFPLALLMVRRIKPPLFSLDRLPALVGWLIWKEHFIFFRAATDTINGYGSVVTAEGEPKLRKCSLHPSFRARRQSSGTVPTLPSLTLTSKFPLSQDHNRDLCWCLLEHPTTRISSSAPSPLQTVPKDGAPTPHWGRQPLVNYSIPLQALAEQLPGATLKPLSKQRWRSGRGRHPLGCPWGPTHPWLPLDSWFSSKHSA